MAILKSASFARDTGLKDRFSWLLYLKSKHTLNYSQQKELEKLLKEKK